MFFPDEFPTTDNFNAVCTRLVVVKAKFINNTFLVLISIILWNLFQ